PEEDELGERARQSAERRGDDEDREARHVHALLAEEPAEKRRERHDDDGRDGEPGGDPGDLLERRAHRAAEVRERHVHDGRVDGAHQGAEGHGDGDEPLVRGSRRRSGGGWKGGDGGGHRRAPPRKRSRTAEVAWPGAAPPSIARTRTARAMPTS